MSSFEIPDAPASISLKRATVDGKPVTGGSAAFTVNNKAGRQLSGRLKVTPVGDAKAEWFKVQGDAERPFADAESQKVTVNIAVPEGTPPGEAKFRLQAINVNDPGNDYAESAVVTMTIPAKDKGKTPWPLIIGIAAVLVLAVIGIVAWLIFGGGGEQPAPVAEAPVAPVVETVQIPTDIGTRPFGEVRLRLIGLGLQVSETPVNGRPVGQEPNTVVSSDPAPGTTVNKNSPVTLTVDPGVVVPSFNNLSELGVLQKANEVDLRAKKIEDKVTEAPFDRVVGQVPDPNTVVAADSFVTVIIRVRDVCRVPPISPLCFDIVWKTKFRNRCRANAACVLNSQ